MRPRVVFLVAVPLAVGCGDQPLSDEPPLGPAVLPMSPRNAAANAAATTAPGTPSVGTSSARTGSGIFWDPAKAAFRAGEVDGTEWDDANVGVNSIAMGRRAIASGSESQAIGSDNTASGKHSTALGNRATASGSRSTSFGYLSTASGSGSMAMGDNTTASGHFSTAMGLHTIAYPYASVALGRYNRWFFIPGSSQTSWVATDPVLVVGNGSSDANRSNAFTLLKNGNLIISGKLTESSDARLKDDVRPLSNVLPKLASIRGVTYRFKDEHTSPAGQHVGLLAQEVQEAFPELVHEGSEGQLSLAYGKFTAVLLEAIKEQQATILELEAAMQRLESAMAGMQQ